MTDQYSTLNKALIINQDSSRYGAFAEIGAGQEVARHFFQAGLASRTVAKTMSAYDMKVSDDIYGQESGKRYVCESRLMKMLNQEYRLLEARLAETRGQESSFFVFADTVTTGSDSERSHGWLGVKFQTGPGSPTNTLILHCWMRDRFRLEQQEALGILGINLIFGAIYFTDEPKLLIRSLLENIKSNRIWIDMIRFDGPAFEGVDNRLMSLELLRQRYTNLVMFDKNGMVQQPTEVLYNRPVFVQRGTFRPVTNVNLEMMKHGVEQFERDNDCVGECAAFMELTMNRLIKDDTIDESDFLARVDTINAVGYPVLISGYNLYYELNVHLRRLTRRPIGLIIGATHLDLIFSDEYYQDLTGGTLQAFGQTLHQGTSFYVFPFKAENKCVTADSWNPPEKLKYFYKHLLVNGMIRDVADCDHVDMSTHSQKVRTLLAEGSDEWESLVPKEIVTIIKERELFRNG